MQLKVIAIGRPRTLESLKHGFGEASPDCLFSGFVDLGAARDSGRESPPDLVIVDELSAVFSNPDAMGSIREVCPDCEIVVATEQGDITTDVELMKTGAYGFVRMPVTLEALQSLIEGIHEKNEVGSEGREIVEAMEKQRVHPIVSHSPEMEKVLSIAARAAASDATVLIKGESGTGKELVARAIHLVSPRRNRTFVTVNIAALSENIIESELFGHIRGSFTGAMADRGGRLEQADRGTLFIDEIGDIPAGIQVKLLRFLQFGTFERVGENESRKVDIRIIAATNRDLETDIHEGKFRADLFYRINVVPITVPPLRDHRSDIPYLVEHMIRKHAFENRKSVRGITAEAVAKIMRYSFPGNIRELENIIERGVVLTRGDLLTETDIFLPELERRGERGILDNPEDHEHEDLPYEEAMEKFEKKMLRKALTVAGWNKSAAARALGIGERRLRYRMNILSVDEREQGKVEE